MNKNNPFSGISIFIDKNVHGIYEKLAKRASSNVLDFPFGTMKDLFIVSACAGANAEKFRELKSSRDIFSGEIFDEKIDVPILFALAYKKTKDVDVLLDPKKMLEIAQGWANGGIHIVEENILGHPGRPLNNLVNWLFQD
ncbi:MAG TPA: hypothetical protein PLT92_14225 [Ignavibacteriaceae bacterium]|nr:hypothetical protein [Ignavibacteriaceae bacterium]